MASTGTGSSHSMAYIEEVTFGTTPATPTFTPIRHTGATLALTKTTTESAEVTADRQIKNLRHGNRAVNGDVSIEMSYGSHDDLLEAALCGTWDVGVPSVGIDQLQVGITRRSFTIERKFSNLDAPEWHRFTGCHVNGFSLNIAPDAIVTATFPVVGEDLDTPATSAIAGSSYSAETTTIPFDSFSGTITEGGSAIAIVTALDMTLENGMNPLYVVGSQTTLEPSISKSRVTGTMTVFFQSAALLNKFISETASALIFTLVDAAGNQYEFTLPSIKYTGGQPDVSGEGEITLSMPFTALYDATEGSNLTIERNPV